MDRAQTRPIRLLGDDQEDRPLPLANLDAEAALLGALMIDNRLVDRAADKLRPDDFSDPLFARIFAAILGECAAGRAANPVTLRPLLATDPDIEAAGGLGLLAKLTGSGAVLIGATGFVEQIADLAARRRLVARLQGVIAAAQNPGSAADQLLLDVDEASSEIVSWSIGLPGASPEALAFGQAWDNSMATVRAIGAGSVKRGAQIAGLLEWNDITGGMHPGQMILLGGRPGMGKTAVALSVARGAGEAGHGVLFISREMPVEQLMFRLIADMLFEAGSTATFDDVQHGRLSAEEYALANRIREKIDGWPIVFEEPAQLNASRVAPMIRKHQRRMAARGQKLELVIIDYLGLLDPPQSRANREQEMSDVSRAVKMAARAAGVAIVALAQLNRAVEQRDDKRPLLSDLRDSGSLEQDADTVVFAFRREYYLQQAEPDPSNITARDAWELELQVERDRLEVYSAKVRQGAPQRRRCYFFGRHQAVRGVDFHRSGGGWI